MCGALSSGNPCLALSPKLLHKIVQCEWRSCVDLAGADAFRVVDRIHEEQVLLGVAGDAGCVQLPGARRELGHGADEGRGRAACNLVPRRPCALLLDAGRH